MPAKTHGESGSRITPEYRAWTALKNRVNNPRNKSYRHYGGRGITVCVRWRNSYPAFLTDMGRRPSLNHTIERKKNDGNYEPGNCKWATRKEQIANQRSHIKTHCPKGHLRSVDVNRVRVRVCLTCMKDACRRRRERQKGATTSA